MTLVGTFAPSYDANGNVLNDGAHTYSWDADGNAITADGVGVAYDALDRAVEQNRSGSYTQIVYGPGGDKLALMNAQSLVKAFVSLSGGATAVYTSAGLDHYRHADWLGSNRLSSTPSRIVQWSGAYAPWGELYASSPSGSPDPSFTGQNSDTSSTGEYDFLYRQYGTQGRWPNPDPAGMAAANPLDPQSWNRYSYVLNNPLGLRDPLGLYCVYLDDSGNRVESIDNFSDSGSCDTSGGYWIAGDYRAGSSWININADKGTITGLGFDVNGNSELSVAGAMDSNAWGAWTQTFAGYTGGDPSLSLTLPPIEWQGSFKNLMNLDVCIVRNAQNFSISGVSNLTTGYEVPLGSNEVTDTALWITGNAGLSETATGAAGLGKQIFDANNKQIMTNGPNSMTSLFPKRGSPQPVLGNSTNYGKSFLKKAGKVAGAAKGVADVALSGALVVDCLAGQVH